MSYKSSHNPPETSQHVPDALNSGVFNDSDLDSFLAGDSTAVLHPADSSATPVVSGMGVSNHAQKPNVSASVDGMAVVLTGQSFARSPDVSRKRNSIVDVSSWTPKH